MSDYVMPSIPLLLPKKSAPEREYYLLECKGEKDRIEAPVIREPFGKLNNRIDVRGIVISTSGFTEGAVKQVEDYIGPRITLLFGGEDVRDSVTGKLHSTIH